MDYMKSRVNPTPKGAKLKPSPVAKKSEKELNTIQKKAIKSLNDTRAKKEAAENKALQKNRRTAGAIVAGMITAAGAMYRENKKRNPDRHGRL